MNKATLPVNTSILFATFSVWHNNKRSPLNGNIDTLRDFLVPKVKKLVIIDQLHPGSDEVMPNIEVYAEHSTKCISHHSSWYIYCLKPLLEMFNTDGTHIIFKIRDFLSVIDWSLRDATKFDYVIGMESINAMAGIFLRKLRRVHKVIYYVFDYSPNRFSNRLFNWIYFSLDRFCAMHADYIWDVSKAIQPARISVGLDPGKSAPVIHVPIGLYPNQIQANPESKIIKHSLVYMGTLGLENGPDIAIQALALVRKKFRDAALHIIGGADKEIAELQKLARSLHVKEAITFHGMIPDSLDMSKIMRSCAIGLAPYRNIFGSIRFYADSSKIRAYCAAGLPTLSTKVPPLGREIAKKGAAVISNDDPYSFAKAICAIFSDIKLYKKLRKNAIRLAKYNTWDNTFANAFQKISKI